jgi:hypothetical protein
VGVLGKELYNGFGYTDTMVLRAKRAKNGRMMYFKDNKLISKARYLSAKSRSKGSKRSKARSPNKKNGARRMKRTLPHPSVTGMASGLAIASYLNAGKTAKDAKFGTSKITEGVIKDITDGELGTAFSTLSNNAINMIGSDDGRKVLIGSSLIAVAGAFARSRFPQLKLGGSKLYFRL